MKPLQQWRLQPLCFHAVKHTRATIVAQIQHTAIKYQRNVINKSSNDILVLQFTSNGITQEQEVILHVIWMALRNSGIGVWIPNPSPSGLVVTYPSTDLLRCIIRFRSQAHGFSLKSIIIIKSRGIFTYNVVSVLSQWKMRASSYTWLYVFLIRALNELLN